MACVVEEDIGVHIIDTTKQRLSETYSFRNSTRVSGIALENNLLYILCIPYGRTDWELSIYDISVPTAPKYVERYALLRNPDRLTVINSVAYVTDNRGLHIVDFSQGFERPFVGSYYSFDRFLDIYIRDSLAYLPNMAGMSIVDVSVLALLISPVIACLLKVIMHM